IDEQGCVLFLGRAKDMIKAKGMSVFPAEVEKLLGGHPEVDVAAVVPVPDPEHGQLPVAFVTLAAGSGLDAAGLEAWAREAMASYKVPRVVIVEEFPMTDTGKIRKVGLVDQARQTFPTT
ncbi:AMP-binding enzyme, partial [Arsenicicoccus bolidensis]|uniref:AMP-binding enzyme n=1 Tax=Arsenicicoccus bolidensis TaxID=229480 RepID=UPI00406BBD7A